MSMEVGKFHGSIIQSVLYMCNEYLSCLDVWAGVWYEYGCDLRRDYGYKENIMHDMHIDNLVTEAIGRVFGFSGYTFQDKTDLSLLPTSGATFPGGGHYKIELVGPNSPSTLGELVVMTFKAGIPVHRVVGTLGGLQNLSDRDIQAIADISDLAGIEFIATPIMPLTNVEGTHPSQGSFFGIHLRGTETVGLYLYQLLRGIELGLRSFLIWDFAALECAEYLRAKGAIPSDVSFKVSIFGGSANIVDIMNWKYRYNHHSPGDRLTAVTAINPVALSVYGFAELRRSSRFIPSFDVHITTLDSMGGLDRTEESHEIIRVASPVSVKIERGEDVSAMMDEKKLLGDVLPKVIESAEKFLKHMANYPELRMEPVVKE